MNFKLLCCIGMGVFVAHLMVFMIIERVRTLRDPIGPPPATPVPLRVAEEIVVDRRGGRTLGTAASLQTSGIPPRHTSG